MEAIKLLEEEITEQFNVLVDVYQKFPNPFLLYTFRQIPNIEEFFKGIKEDMFFEYKRDDPQRCSWAEISRFYEEVIGTNEALFIAGLICKEVVNWPMTIMKNCELAYGLDDKEFILFQGTEIKIIKIEVKNFVREL